MHQRARDLPRSPAGGRAQLVVVAIVATLAGFAGGLLSGGPPATASPEAQRMYGSGVHAWLRSSTRVPLIADQRGSGAVFELRATAAVADVRSNKPIRINKLLIVPFGTDAGIVTMTPTPTNTPTATNTPTITPSPTP